MSKPKSKIVFFLPSLEIGGAERNTINILNNLNRDNYVISLVLGEKKGEFITEVPKDISIIDLNTSSNLSLFFKIRKYFKDKEPYIFISAFPRFNVINLLAKIFSKTKTKFIITEHKTPSLLSITSKTFTHRFIAYFFLPYLIKFIYPKSKAIICVSKGVADDILRIINNPAVESKIRVIYNPITNQRIGELAKEPVDHLWFSNSKVPVILSVGRLIKAKDFPNLLKATALMLKKQELHLVIIGEGPEKENLKKLARQLDITKNVEFLGFQKNPYKYMKRASVFVLSSFHEGFGNVIVEAMASGVPIVSTDCVSGPNEIIEPGKNGILVPIKDEKALAQAIMQVLNNPSLNQRLIQEGRKRSEFFSITKSVEEYEKLFQELININD